MDNTKAKILADIRQMLQMIPAYDEQATFAKSAIFQALNELEPWLIAHLQEVNADDKQQL